MPRSAVADHRVVAIPVRCADTPGEGSRHRHRAGSLKSIRIWPHNCPSWMESWYGWSAAWRDRAPPAWWTPSARYGVRTVSQPERREPIPPSMRSIPRRGCPSSLCAVRWGRRRRPSWSVTEWQGAS
jgi:hypothetical protein